MSYSVTIRQSGPLEQTQTLGDQETFQVDVILRVKKDGKLYQPMSHLKEVQLFLNQAEGWKFIINDSEQSAYTIIEGNPSIPRQDSNDLSVAIDLALDDFGRKILSKSFEYLDDNFFNSRLKPVTVTCTTKA
jgi:hypothetical protein